RPSSALRAPSPAKERGRRGKHGDHMKESFGAQRASYRQGLVLGLTMAEIMLLMVFTLLLVAGALLQKSHSRIKEMNEQEATFSQAQLAEIKSLRDELSRARNIRLPENWRELV